MKNIDLMEKYLGVLDDKNYNEKTLRILSNLVDVNKDGYIKLF